MNDYERSCYGKTRFLIRAHAKQRASTIRREGGGHFRTYQCRHCGLWHLGNLPGRASHLRTTPQGVYHLKDLTT
ncbi:hypothetical protein [Streptomyces sp. NPDC006551]|uniref:hypothetical protein n=1 Tax=Streptomyces sp. NPDC006551 TaxID=3157178 RepID=UPI0033A52516